MTSVDEEESAAAADRAGGSYAIAPINGGDEVARLCHRSGVIEVGNGADVRAFAGVNGAGGTTDGADAPNGALAAVGKPKFIVGADGDIINYVARERGLN